MLRDAIESEAEALRAVGRLEAQIAGLKRELITHTEAYTAADTAVEAAHAALTLGEGDQETIDAAEVERAKARDVARGTNAAIRTLEGRLAEARAAHEQRGSEVLMLARPRANELGADVRERIAATVASLCDDLRLWTRLENLARGNGGFIHTHSGEATLQALGIADARGRCCHSGVDLEFRIGVREVDAMTPAELASMSNGGAE